MSGILWSRRPSDGTVGSNSGGSNHVPRPRTTSGGGIGVISSVLGLSKIKSRERLRNNGTSSVPSRSSNRQTVVSTESGSSDVWPNEPTTPSSASDTKRSFQGIGMSGVGLGVGDDPFAREPVFVSKESPAPSLASFPDPPQPRRQWPAPATQRNGSTGPALLLDPGPSRHLHPPSVSPRSSTLMLSPRSSRPSSPNRSRSTSASSSLNPPSGEKSPRTPPPIISCVSPADMHAHAVAAEHSWGPDEMSIYDVGADVDIRSRHYEPNSRHAHEMHRPEDVPAIRRGQSAHAVLASGSSSRLPPAPRLLHSASSSHLSSTTYPQSPPANSHLSTNSPHHAGRAGSSATSGMGSMTALASGIVKGLEDESSSASGSERRKGPPKRPSKSLLREQPSSSSLANHIQPPRRKESLVGLQGNGSDAGRSPASVARSLEPPRSPEGVIRSLGPTPRSPELTPNVSPPRPRTASSPGRSRPPKSPPRHRTLTSPGSPPARYAHCPPAGFSPSSPPSSLFPHSPPSFFPHSSPPTRLAFPPTHRLSEDSEDLDNYEFTIAPTIQETDAYSISLSELGVTLNEEEDLWSEKSLTFNHADSSRNALSNRRPPPSPTNLPFMAGNAGRRLGRDMVYPSGVHTIPIADLAGLRGLATLGEDLVVGNEEDAVVGRSSVVIGRLNRDVPGVDLDASTWARDGPSGSMSTREYTSFTKDETPTGSSPSPVNPLERISSVSTGTSSCSSMAPEKLPPQTVTSYVAFSRHARTESHSDSELDFDSPLAKSKPTRHHHVKSTQTAIAWRCGSGNHEKCCGTRSLQQGHNTGKFKCCAERTPSGKIPRCCASFIGMPCERQRVSSTSSASVSDLKRQRSLHFPNLPAHAAPSASGGKRSRFFRPHTSHGKSTSSTLMDEDLKAMIGLKPSREDPGPQSPMPEGCATIAPVSVASPPTSPVGKQEFQARPIISPSKLNNHLKETLVTALPVSIPDPVKSPKLGPVRGRSDTTTTAATTDTSTSASVRSVLTNQSDDSPAPMKKLFPPRPRRNQNVSLPTMTTTQSIPPPRRYVQSITTVVHPSGSTRPLPPPRSPVSGAGFSSLSSGPSGSALPPPSRVVHGRINAQPIVSFISSRSAPSPAPANAGLRHRSSRESYESSRTVRRERSIPLLREMSFLEFEEEVSEEEEEDLVEPQQQQRSEWTRPALQQTQSFLDLSSRQSGDTMRENMAMFS
ncbi:unnamed protein product [Rhizoctonia solani]|uniref:Uncharacterized protein n=1 Tax=Rhizoctonia solani TaxID=456999 RepID=A0A8H3BED6_9AGAM|nr:unnamed protein product [Rhizoctonia solani]